MAPKKAAAAPAGPAALPTIEDEVQWPEGVEPVPDPGFRCAIAHVVSHIFMVDVEKDNPSAPLQEFEPCKVLVEKLSQPGDDPKFKHIVPVPRDMLQGIAEGGSLAEAFVKKVERERLAGHRRKVNAARTRHIANEPEAVAVDDSDGLDLVLVIVDYPSNAEEVEQLREASGFEAADAWISMYLAGHTVEVIEAEADEEAEPKRIRKACQAPEPINAIYDAIHAAPLGTGLANSTIRTCPNIHLLSLSVGEEADRLIETVVDVAEDVASLRRRFDAWIDAAPRVALAGSVPDPEQLDSRLYEQLADSIDPSRHDVAFLLHCMCEQVAGSLQGDVRDRKEDKVDPHHDDNDLHALHGFLEDAHESVLVGEPHRYQPSTTDAAASPLFGPEPVPGTGAREEEEPGDGSMVLPELDFAANRHYGYRLPGNVSVLDEVHRLLSRLEAQGVRRSGFPDVARPLKSAMSAARNKIYTFMPEMPIVEIERLYLVHEFEKLLNKAQPERTWVLKDRVFHERIPSALLIQILTKAAQSQCFVDTAYLYRHDCLLIAMHHRAPAGRLIWHSWNAPTGGSSSSTAPAPGDNGGASHDPRKELDSICPTPTFNDWRQLLAEAEVAAAAANGSSPDRPQVEPGPATLLDADGRQMGYCKVIEKLHIPSDGSVILRTSLRRGLAETFERPSGGPDPPEQQEAKEEDSEDDGATETAAASVDARKAFNSAAAIAAAAAFDPAPLRELRVARVVKDGLTFGILTDEVWAAYASRLRTEREERERIEAEAAANAEAERAEAQALRIAQGLPEPEQDAQNADGDAQDTPADGEEEEEEKGAPAGDGVTDRKLEALQFGILCVNFPDGARCTARMHHERRWFVEGELSYDTCVVRPGVLVSFSPASGCLVQVFSNGHVRQMWPQQVVATAISAGNGAGAMERAGVALFPSPPPVPTWAGVLGGPEDVELARVATPFGVLIRELLSGRREVYYPNGVQAVRNPTLDEAREQRQRLTKSGLFKRPGLQESFTRLAAKVEQLEIGNGGSKRPSRVRRPTVQEKATGLPGHWRVAHPDGRVFGRFSLPEEPPSEEGDVAGDGGEEAAATDAQPGETDKGDDEFDDDSSLSAILQNVLGGVVVDDGKTIEYEIDAPAAVTPMYDPHTGHTLWTSGSGLVSYQDSQGNATTAILPDGTHMIRTEHPDGCEVFIEKDCTARVTCTINDKHKGARTLAMDVDCGDGTRLRVTPQSLNFNGYLIAADPLIGEPDTLSTNAAVQVLRPDGTVVNSKGSGEVDVISRFESGGGDLGKTMDRGRIYSAALDYDTMTIHDRDGNVFTLAGDQTVQFTIPGTMSSSFASPRLTTPGEPHWHPDAGYVQVPDKAPEPRLFAVYSDGDAEELLPTRDALEVLRVAKHDPDTVVTEEPMAAPMQSCKCHTILKTTSSELSSVPLRPVELPPIIAGFEGLGASIGLRSQAPRQFTQFRQLVEHPAVSEKKRKLFLDRRAAYEESEEKHKELHVTYGSGFGTTIGANGGGA